MREHVTTLHRTDTRALQTPQLLQGSDLTFIGKSLCYDYFLWEFKSTPTDRSNVCPWHSLPSIRLDEIFVLQVPAWSHYVIVEIIVA